MASEGRPNPLPFSRANGCLLGPAARQRVLIRCTREKSRRHCWYDVDETPPLLVRLGVSIQHVFLMSVGWLCIVVIVNSIGGTARQTENLTRMSMIAAGISTILLATRGAFGSGYFCPLSSSLTYLPPSILAVRMGGFSLLFGMVATAGLLTGLLSRVTNRLRIQFPPEVMGLMVARAGLQLVSLGCPRFVGYAGTEESCTHCQCCWD